MTTETLDTTQLARVAHRYLEPLHTLVYFVPENGERYQALGIEGGMRGYMASRSGPFGEVPAEVVIAAFYNFAPAQVRKAIPSVWSVTTPKAVLEARLDGADAALRRLLPDDINSEEMRRAAELAREATTVLDVVGRPLYAAHAALAWPEPAHLQLWHAATLLREHRGDGHIAALVLAGLSGLDAALTYVATGKGMPDDLQRQTRGYDEDEWTTAKQRLVDDGLLTAAGALTDEGQALRADLEARTDAAAAAPYEHLGPERTQELIDLCRPWARSVSKQIFG
jgi:helix-turn-helix protein